MHESSCALVSYIDSEFVNSICQEILKHLPHLASSRSKHSSLVASHKTQLRFDTIKKGRPLCKLEWFAHDFSLGDERFGNYQLRLGPGHANERRAPTTLA